MAAFEKEGNGAWSVIINKKSYNLQEIPDPWCPAVRDSREELEESGLDPRDLLYSISNTIACWKISTHGLAAAGQSKFRDELYKLGRGVADLIGEIENAALEMKSETDSILSNMQYAVIYTLDGYEAKAKEKFKTVGEQAEGMVQKYVPVVKRIKKKRADLENSAVYEAGQKRLVGFQEVLDNTKERLIEKTASTEDERARIGRNIEDIDRDMAEARGQYFQFCRGTAARIKYDEKARRDFIYRKEDIEKELARIKENFDNLKEDSQWQFLPLLTCAIRSMVSYICNQQKWWEEVIVCIKPRVEEASKIGDEVDPKAFKLRVIRIYFRLVALGSLAMISKKYLHKCYESFDKVITDNPNQTQGAARLRGLVYGYEKDTLAIMSDIKDEVEKETLEYESKLKQRREPDQLQSPWTPAVSGRPLQQQRKPQLQLQQPQLKKEKRQRQQQQHGHEPMDRATAVAVAVALVAVVLFAYRLLSVIGL